MKIFTATTKSGKSYQVRLVEIKPTDPYKKLGVEGSHNKVAEIKVGEEWIRCWASKVGSEDKQQFAIQINALNNEAQDALSIPEKMRDKDTYIACDNWHVIYEEMLEDAEKSFEAIANALVFSKITLHYNTSWQWGVYDTDNEALSDYIRYNKVINDLDATLKYVHPKSLSKYLVDSDRGDYTITDRFEIPFEDVKKIIDLSLPELKEAKEKKEEQERDRKDRELKRKNIEYGVIYFTCESDPHDEHLSDIILNSPAPNGGIFTLDHRVDKDLFDRIKSHGRYWDREFLEDCDMFEDEPGWRFNVEAVKELAKDHQVFVNDQPIKQYPQQK